MPLTTPNFVVFISDDQERTFGPDNAQAMPWMAARTDWIRFPNAIQTVPLCGPARVSFLTGRRADRHPTFGNAGTSNMDPATTMPVALRNAGYQTALMGKYLNHYDDDSVPPGWDAFTALRGGQAGYFYDYTLTHKPLGGDAVAEPHGSSAADYFTDVIAAKAQTFLAAATAPFCLVVPFTAPHAPSTPAPRHNAAAISRSDPPDWNVKPTNGPQWLSAAGTMDATRETATRNDSIAAARTCIGMDEAIEDITTAALAKDPNTVIVFFTDNGHSKGRKGIGQNAVNLQKRSPYRYTTDPLLCIRYPGEPGRTERAFVSTLDVTASLLAWAGATPLLSQDGKNLTRLIEEGAPIRSDVDAYYAGNTEQPVPGWHMLRTERWRYARYFQGHSSQTADEGFEELYDWNADPHETNNVAAANPSVVAELSARLDDLASSPHSPVVVPPGSVA